MVSDSEEEARNLDVVLLTVALAESCARNTIFIAQNLYGVMLEENFDVRSVENTLLHSLRCAKEWLANDKIYLTAERCKVGSLLASGVATTHNCYILLAVEEAVASSTSTYAHTAELLLRLQTEILCRCSGADDNCLGLNLLLAINSNNKWACSSVDIGDNTGANIGAKAQSLSTQIVHHLGTLNTLRIAREVLDLCGCCELTARLDSLVQNRVEGCARSVDSSGKTGRSATNDKYFSSLHIRNIFVVSLLYFDFILQK